GTAPPVMLMICWFCCAPSRNGEAGAETAIPGCKIKFELRSRKKIRRNTTSMSGNRTSQPKLYSLLRLSFMPRSSIWAIVRHGKSVLADRSSDRDALLEDRLVFRVTAEN